MKKIKMPVSTNPIQTVAEVECDRSIVVIGANGSGKSRLGTWIEFKSEEKLKVHRISAQKSLTMPDDIKPISVDKSRTLLHYGYYDERNISNLWQYKEGQRWGRSPETFLLNDYDKLMTYLFSDNYKQAIDYKNNSMKSTVRIEPPITLIDQVVQIWENVITHRRLKISSSSIETSISTNSEVKYKSQEMSDGERVVFYLIGECLSAPVDGIVIVDEPELHIHKSIQRKLWDEIENKRMDCTFIYLTHDFDFATSRVGSTIVQMNSYDGVGFDWQWVDSVDGIADDVLFEILGSRVPIVFIEGEKGSYDTQLYSLAYPDYTIKPVGSCEKVIEATKSFKNNHTLHNVECFGIIDRDYKPTDFIAAYEDDGVYCPKVAEVENLFIVEEVLLEVAKLLFVTEPEKKVEEIKEWVINEFDKFKEVYATESTSALLNFYLNSFDGGAKNISNLKSKYENLSNNFSIEETYNKQLEFANDLISGNEYSRIISVFNHKAILNQVGKFYDIKPSVYTSKVKNIIEAGNTVVLESIKSYLPSIG